MDALLLIKASLVLAAALAAAYRLRRRSAASRHRLWTIAFAATLALPLLAAALPVLDVPVPRVRLKSDATTARTIAAGTASPSVAAASAVAPASAGVASDFSRTSVVASGVSRTSVVAAVFSRTTLLALWMIGTTAAVSTLLVSLLGVRRLARSGEEMDDAGWRRAADAIGARLGLGRPARLIVSDAVGTPMAGGLWRPIVFLPMTAREWTADRRDVVLAHELAHLAGRDPLRHVVARLAVAIYWFHPLAWIAAHQAAVAREQACDEAVLALGTRPSTYATVLLDLAEALRGPAPALAALPMVERSLLEARLMAILDSTTPPAARRRLLLPAAGVLLLTLPLAAARPTESRARATGPDTSDVSGSLAVSEAPERGPDVSGSVAPAPAQPAAGDSACWARATDNRSFDGSISTSGTIVNEQIGWRGTDRIIQKTLGDLRVCLIAEDAGDRRSGNEPPSGWTARARRVVIEARRGNTTQTLTLMPQAGVTVTTWRVNGAERPFDAAAQRWRDRMFAVLDAQWELSTLRGDVSSLHGEISSIRGEASSIRGEISSYRGEVSSMRGHISSLHGNESSLRGEISSLRGHVSSLQGAISSERGAISSLNASRWDSSDADRQRIAERIREHDTRIAQIEKEIKDFDVEARIAKVEREIRDANTAGKVAEVERDIRTFDVEAKVAAAERRLAALDVEGKVAAIERRIAALDADRRGRQLEERRDAAVKDLEAAIAAIR